ncbi:hypothetical protein ABXN37_05235 [Piscinibacter sakaiensis]|uniref:hypothetical protein n=1 Tax=Piscinibacter sakaiensis TaxID=1547922 RepID=UPI003726F75F
MPNNIATPTPLRPARPTSSARPAASGARRWAIAGAVVGSLAALVWNAPAQWLASAVGRASGPGRRCACSSRRTAASAHRRR